MKPERETLIAYRRERAQTALNDAQMLLDAGSLLTAVNRIYYALFYEVMALLLTKDLKPTTHTGTKAFFNQSFIKTSIIDQSLGKFYANMFDYRQEADYNDFVKLDIEKVRQWLIQAQDFIGQLEKLF